jgi:hypothetical protein
MGVSTGRVSAGRTLVAYTSSRRPRDVGESGRQEIIRESSALFVCLFERIATDIIRIPNDFLSASAGKLAKKHDLRFVISLLAATPPCKVTEIAVVHGKYVIEIPEVTVAKL